MSYARRRGALARKDLLLELRARETLPAMLLFVLSALVVFHFALPAAPSRLAASGLLWVAIVFTALLGLTRAFAPEREQRHDRRARARALRPRAIWLAKSIATLAFLVAAEIVAVPAFALFFHRVDGSRSPASCSPTSASAPSGRCSRRWRAGRARELLLPLLFLPLAIPVVVGGVGASPPARRAATSASWRSTTCLRAIAWASFEYVVTE